MSYSMVRRGYGESKQQAEDPSVGGCESGGGKWDYGLNACICPPGSTYDSSSGSCLDDIKPSVSSGGGTSSGSGVISRPDIPEITVPVEDAKTVGKGIGMGWALLGGLGLIGIGGGLAYFVFGGPKPYYKPEFELED